MDMYQFGLNTELVYEGSTIGYNANLIRFSHCCSEQIHDLTYCMNCYHCSHLFGCVGIRHAKYCILNKQYTKKDYEQMVLRIIEHMKSSGEWGEFYPAGLSSFGYNETTAALYFPLAKEEALSRGFNWRDEDVKSSFTGNPPELPDSIDDVDDRVTDWVLKCESSSKRYKITAQELAFYRRVRAPLPRHCFEQRHKHRIARRNPRSLFDRSCDSCRAPVVSVFSSARKETVYCERCFQQALS
jgi:hypothetical protein